MQRPAASPSEGKRHRKKPLNKMFDANSAPDDVKKLPPKVTHLHANARGAYIQSLTREDARQIAQAGPQKAVSPP